MHYCALYGQSHLHLTDKDKIILIMVHSGIRSSQLSVLWDTQFTCGQVCDTNSSVKVLILSVWSFPALCSLCFCSSFITENHLLAEIK